MRARVVFFLATAVAVGACSSSSTNAAAGGGAAGASTGGSNTGGSGTGGSGNTDGGNTGGSGGISGAAGTSTGGVAGATGDAGFQCPSGTKGPTLVNAGNFCIDATEVTNSQYDTFLKDNPSSKPTPPAACTGDTHDPYTDSGCPTFALSTEPQLPVVCVDWCDAQAYCAWAGKRLCGSITSGFGTPLPKRNDATESEWYAGCVGNPSQPDKFFYGSGDTGKCVGANVGSIKHAGETTACQSFWLKGLFDMSGNVAEWEDACDNVTSPNANCLVRGGSFNSVSADLACDATQQVQRGTYAADRGFRCCWDSKVP